MSTFQKKLLQTCCSEKFAKRSKPGPCRSGSEVVDDDDDDDVDGCNRCPKIRGKVATKVLEKKLSEKNFRF